MSTTIEIARRRFALMAAEHALVIGARIREARAAIYIDGHQMTQRELAEKLPGKTTPDQVSKWERGLHRVGDDTLAHIAKVLKRDLAWFHTSPADKSKTPDVMGVLDGNGSQLDRIEANIKQILMVLRRWEDADLPATSDEAAALAADAVPLEEAIESPGKKALGRSPTPVAKRRPRRA